VKLPSKAEIQRAQDQTRAAHDRMKALPTEQKTLQTSSKLSDPIGEAFEPASLPPRT
jgi:hypothetical protein